MTKDIRRFAVPKHQSSPTHVASAIAAMVIGLGIAAPAAAVGSLAGVDVVLRPNGQSLPVVWGQGRPWVAGEPGREYAIRICNRLGARILAVTSVDGVNVVTGATASPEQSGYVIDAYACTEVAGWRKNMQRTAAFYFTELPDAYATRTGRPDNLGVIGVAVFREKQAVVWRAPAKVAAESARGEGGAAPAQSSADASGMAKRFSGDAAPSAPAAAAPLGTGHGRSETSHAHYVSFQRDSEQPAETIAIHYDRHSNLVAMGLIPPPVIARTQPANPFPAAPGFVPDPPRW